MYIFIQVKDGQPVNHPALPANLVQAFGAIPPDWEPFLRVPRPNPGVYEVVDSDEPTYQKVDGVWTDVWSVRSMTPEEKTAKQQATISAFRARPQAENWSAWSLDEATCTMAPPIPRPGADQEKLNAGIHTFWCGAENGWKDTPVYPVGGGQYVFDFLAWQWAEAQA